MAIAEHKEVIIERANDYIAHIRKKEPKFALGIKTVSLKNYQDPNYLSNLLMECNDYQGETKSLVDCLQNTVKNLLDLLK